MVKVRPKIKPKVQVPKNFLSLERMKKMTAPAPRRPTLHANNTALRRNRASRSSLDFSERKMRDRCE
eukprot:scaffold110435_cov46-Cyclotella_meneghiniana.AAC.1